MRQPDLVHDQALLPRLLAQLRGVVPDMRGGTMFGCPAAYVGGKLAFCVYGTDVGAKLPESRARALLAEGTATPFRPYGKPAMRAWVQLSPDQLPPDALRALLAEALDHARSLGRISD